MEIEPTPLPCAPFEAAAVVCFIVAPARRRQGVAQALLAAALTSLTERGFKLVDAFPFKAGDSESSTDHYHGPLSMFLTAGFTVLREEETMTVVRKMF